MDVPCTHGFSSTLHSVVIDVVLSSPFFSILSRGNAFYAFELAKKARNIVIADFFHNGLYVFIRVNKFTAKAIHTQ